LIWLVVVIWFCFSIYFGFFGHPEVYIIILPVFGFVSSLLEFVSLRLVFGYSAMCYSLFSISCVGFFVWAHHMFTVGLDLDSRLYFGLVTLFIGLPTCIKLFNWFLTSFGYDYCFCFSFLWVVVFYLMFLVGGITGLLLANFGLDILLHDTYFVVAHFHYVLSLGAVVGAFCFFLVFFRLLVFTWVFFLVFLFVCVSFIWWCEFDFFSVTLCWFSWFPAAV